MAEYIIAFLIFIIVLVIVYFYTGSLKSDQDSKIIIAAPQTTTPVALPASVTPNTQVSIVPVSQPISASQPEPTAQPISVSQPSSVVQSEPSPVVQPEPTAQPIQDAPVLIASPTNALAELPPTPLYTSQAPPQPTYVGCYTDTWDRVFTTSPGAVTFSECALSAQKAGAAYFGMQYAEGYPPNIAECWYGGTNYAKHGATNKCTGKDKDGRVLGTAWCNAVYKM